MFYKLIFVVLGWVYISWFVFWIFSPSGGERGFDASCFSAGIRFKGGALGFIVHIVYGLRFRVKSFGFRV